MNAEVSKLQEQEQEQPRLLLFGASGAIGGAIARIARDAGWQTTSVGRSAHPDRPDWLVYDALRDSADCLDDAGIFDAVCWAQGANYNDSLHDFDADRHRELYDANCLAVMASLSALLAKRSLVGTGARLCIVSSIWQERARTNKFSYTVTKAAVGGLVRAAAVDLGVDGHLVNGVLPGVLDTPMTRANLSADQIARVEEKTTHRRLPDLETLAELVLFLCSRKNRSITGESIAVDLGMSNAQLL